MNQGSVIEDYGPYKRLIAAIILQALHDARQAPMGYNSPSQEEEICNNAEDAIDFLCSDRLNIYCEMLEIDPETRRENSTKEQHKRGDDCRMSSCDRSKENRHRYNFRMNYELYRATTSN